VLNADLTECAWTDWPELYNSNGDGLAEIVLNQWRGLMETPLFSPFGQSLIVRHHARSYRIVLDAAMRYASEPKLGLILVHFPIPHKPYFYNRETGEFDLRYSRTAGYMDAIALVDRTLGKLRRAMQDAELWERTTVLVSADHGFRGPNTPDGRPAQERWVPFVLRLAEQPRHYEYHRKLETVRSADLLLRILRREIQSPSEVAAWLDGSDVRQALHHGRD
jgi:arylsulfatase A-like enzyme